MDSTPAVVLPPSPRLAGKPSVPRQAGCMRPVVSTLTPPASWAPCLLSTSPSAEEKAAWKRKWVLFSEEIRIRVAIYLEVGNG